MFTAPKAGGVYLIRNTVSGRFYVGSACSFARRWKEHLKMLRAGTHHNRRLQAAWGKYGESALVFEVLEVVDDPARLLAAEQRHLDQLRATEAGYNHRAHARSSFGVRQSKDVCERNRRAQLGKKLTPEHKAAISAGNARHSPTPEHRARISAANTGRPRPDVARWAPDRFRKLTDDDVTELKRMHASGLRYRAIAEVLGVSLGTVSNAINGKKRCYAEAA